MSITLQDFTKPEDIERRSFEIIEEELGPERRFTGHAWEVARRMVHTCADYSILSDLYIPDESVEAGVAALLAGCRVFTDTEMARAGMPARRLKPLGVEAHCLLSLPGVAEHAAQHRQTLSKSGVEIAGPSLGGSIAAIGNAPTALLALIRHIKSGLPMPALVIAMPVGFVNAAESKALLMQYPEIPSITLCGRRGGSPLVAAVVNALAEIALRSK